MKGVSRHVFVRIVQAIIMKRLVYCFKLDNDEFNLKNKYKKYKPCVTRVYDDLNTIYRYISFSLTRFFVLLLKTEQYRLAFIKFKKINEFCI
ncbi:hypothetical protein B8A01_05240 [Staphylococcus aureus]|nr:hypothetical protein B8A01_05240 [Staphylococcus aureus]REA65564.1 hypothetical protein DV954_05215 [Staphylococcus aureus]